MSDRLFAAFDIGLVFVLAFGLGLWQLVAVRRSIRADRARAAAESQTPGDDPA